MRKMLNIIGGIDATDAEIDEATPKLNSLASQILQTVKDYQPTSEDVAQIIPDITNMTTEQQTELSTFVAGLLNPFKGRYRPHSANGF